jgi:hypothetical protein
MRILTTVGYAPCCNSIDIVNAFYKEQPYRDLSNTIFKQVIKPSLSPQANSTLFYLKSRHDTEPSVRLSKRIQKTPIPLRVNDPRESAVEPLSSYGVQVYAAEGVICHFTSPEREGARLHNARYALVAGMAFGMRKSLLMLAEGDFLAPIDYRDLLRQYSTAAAAEKYLEDWLEPVVENWSHHQTSDHNYAATVKLATELKELQFGEHIAENEADRLVHDYFVDTTSYEDALYGRHTIFVGRKGSGKTANFLKLASELEEDDRNLVCIIKPIAYELQGIMQLLRRYKERDEKGYVVESLWKFLLYTEIANTATHAIEGRKFVPRSKDETALLALLEQHQGMLKEDFSVRLERCVENLISTQQRESQEESIEGFRIAMSETLHSGILRDVRISLGKVLSRKKRIAILIDNLDKAWDKASDINILAEFFLGLLSASGRINDDFKREKLNVSTAIFLRSDIFDKVMLVAREPDKIQYTRLIWDDNELLLRVIEERFLVSHGDNVKPDEMWKRYFSPLVKGIPVKQYILSHILPRPRDLLFFVKAAVTTAINRRHTMVQEGDILDAQKQYSQHTLESILVENGVTVSTLENIIYEFVGSNPWLTSQEVSQCLSRAAVPAEVVPKVINHLCALSFLGVEVNEGDFRFADYAQEYRKNEALAKRLTMKRGGKTRYMVHPAFRAYLEIADP